MFEYPVRNKLRFPYKGNATVEDLWDLNVNALDDIYKTLNTQKKQADEESLLQTRSKEDKVLEVKINFVKHIVEVKLAESEAAAKARENKQEREKIMAIIADKQDEALHNMSIEELQQKLNQMG